MTMTTSADSHDDGDAGHQSQQLELQLPENVTSIATDGGRSEDNHAVGAEPIGEEAAPPPEAEPEPEPEADAGAALLTEGTANAAASALESAVVNDENLAGSNGTGDAAVAAVGSSGGTAATPEVSRQAETSGSGANSADDSNSAAATIGNDGGATSGGGSTSASVAAAGNAPTPTPTEAPTQAAMPSPAQAVAELLRLESVAARQQQAQQAQQVQQGQATSNTTANSSGAGNIPTSSTTGTPIQVRVQLRSSTTGQAIPLSSLPPAEQAQHQSQIMALLRNDPNLQAAIARNASRQRRHEEFGDGGGGGGGGGNGVDESGSGNGEGTLPSGASRPTGTAVGTATTAASTSTPTPLADATNTASSNANTAATTTTTSRSSAASNARSLATGVLNPLDPRGPTCQQIIAQADVDRAAAANLQRQRLVEERRRRAEEQQQQQARRGAQQQQQQQVGTGTGATTTTNNNNQRNGQMYRGLLQHFGPLANGAAAQSGGGGGTRSMSPGSFQRRMDARIARIDQLAANDRDQQQMEHFRAVQAEMRATDAELHRMQREIDLGDDAESARTGRSVEQIQEERRRQLQQLRAAVDAAAARNLELRGELAATETETATPATAAAAAAAAFGVGSRGGVGGRTRAAGHNRPIGRDPATGREGAIAVDPVTGQRVYGFHPGRHIYYPDVDDNSEEANARREELRAMEERGGISRRSSAVAGGAATPRSAQGTGGSGTTTAPGATNATGEDPGALPPGLEGPANTDASNASIVDMRSRRMAEMNSSSTDIAANERVADVLRADINRLRNAIDGAINPTPGNAATNTGSAGTGTTRTTFGRGMDEMQRQIQRLRELQNRSMNIENEILNGPQAATGNTNALNPLRSPTERPGIRMTLGGNAGNTATIMGLPGRPTTAAPRVPPLEAQPLPFPHRHYRAASSVTTDGDSKPAADGSDDSDNRALDEFECKICFEILHEPRGCGSCINRFCKECLEQVWKTGAGRAMNIAAANLDASRIDQARKSGKCPCCRAPFSLTDMVADEDMVKRMSEAGRVICPFPGCSDEIRLTDLKSHEASCGCQPVKCKFTSYGCDWTGVRKELGTHESCDCPYGKISKLVEEVRTLKAGHQQQVAQMQQNLTRVMHQVQIQRSSGAGGGAYTTTSNRDPGSMFDAFEFAALCISYPSKILQNKFCWNKFGETSSQARLVNICTVMPLLIWSLRIIFGSIRRCLYVDRMANQDHQLAVVEDFILALATLPIIGGFAFGFLYDKKFSRAWTTYKWTIKIPWVNRRWPIFRDTTALSATAMVAITLEDGTNSLTIHGVFLWAVVVALTCFYSVVFDYISEMMFFNNSRHQSGIRPRAQRPVVFGLRYGIIVYACNFQLSFVDAVILVRLAKSLFIQKLPEVVTVESTECFFCEFTGKWKLWTSIVILRLSMILAVAGIAGMDGTCFDAQLWGIQSPSICFDGPPKHFLNIFLDLLMLLSINVIVSATMKLAETFAKYLYKERNPTTSPLGGRSNGPRNADYGLGTLTFVSWVVSIGALLMA